MGNYNSFSEDRDATVAGESYVAFAECYDELTGNVDYEKRGQYFHTILKKYGKEKGILLDLACGTGSLSEFFARLNYDVIGVDASEEMLAVAQEKKYESGSNIIYLCQRMEELNLFGTVDIVICALDSINHVVDPEKVQQIFERVSLFLDEDALFIFDVNTVYKHERVLADNTFVYDVDSVYCVWQNHLLPDHVVQMDLDLFSYDEENDCYYREQESFCERAYSEEELASFLEHAGFEVLARYGDDTFALPEETTQRVIYVVRNRFCKNARPEE